MPVTPPPSSTSEHTANALMAIFGLKPKFKVFQAKGSWYVAELKGGEWLTQPKPWPTEQAALGAVPRSV